MPKATVKTLAQASAVASPPAPVSYEAAEQELAALVDRLESGDLPLEELLVGYQRGTQLLAYCRQRLQTIDDQIKVIEDTAEGVVVKSWKPE
jgi:exodeoxyribonuclease VII small subunit